MTCRACNRSDGNGVTVKSYTFALSLFTRLPVGYENPPDLQEQRIGFGPIFDPIPLCDRCEKYLYCEIDYSESFEDPDEASLP